MVCQYVKMNGEPCGRPVGSFTACGHHRERPASKPSRPCTSCGKLTKRESGQCIGTKCGWTDYRRALAQRKRAQSLVDIKQAAADVRANAQIEALFVALADENAPWPSELMGMQRADFDASAEQECQRLEAERREQRITQMESERVAALVAALEMAERIERDHHATVERLRASVMDAMPRDISPSR